MRQRNFTHADRQRLERAIAHYLQRCYRHGTAARVSELAQLLGLDRAYLSRRAAKIFGIPLRDYLRKRQLDEAVRLLRTTPLKTAVIARQSGFGTLGTLHHWFQAAYGTSPAAYREVTK